MALKNFKEEQGIFLFYLSYLPIDSNIIFSIHDFVETDLDSLSRAIIAANSFTETEKVNAIESMTGFVKEISESITFEKINLYDIPAITYAYKKVLKGVLYHLPIKDYLVPLSPHGSRMLARSFWHFKEAEWLDNVSEFKQVASSPNNILSFLERSKGFIFTDSLLMIAVANDALKVVKYLAADSSWLAQYIRQHKNIYLQELVTISKNRNVTELMPFLVQLAEKKLTVDSIIRKRTDVKGYFQLMVNTLQSELGRQKSPGNILLQVLRNGVREKSIAFYVSRINELHNETENIRFFVVKDLRPEDLYYIITSCEDELYTSSYVGLYNRLMNFFQVQPADSLFKLVQFDNFRIFMRMAANYNTLSNFLSCVPADSVELILHRFIAGIEKETFSGLEKAMDIADSFTGLSSFPLINEMIERELKNNFTMCNVERLYFGIRLYNILIKVFELVNNRESQMELWTYLGNHEILRRNALQNRKGDIIEIMLFYGDEDGISSFDNFMELYKGNNLWEISYTEYWVAIRSLTGQPIIIYANLPLDEKTGLDVQAQDSLSKYLEQRKETPSILVHRGHSYHLSKTMVRMQPSVKLAILGSCGGYNSILSVANVSPDAQIIVSKKTGSKFINDPLIDEINETLNSNNDLQWTDVWEKLIIRLSKDPFALNLFSEYIPPRKNVSLFVLKLYNYSN